MGAGTGEQGIQKRLKHFTIYSNPETYAAFPSLASASDATLYCAFRNAPTMRSKTHIDTRSVTVLYESADEGETWRKVSEVKIAPYTGNQDPSLAITEDGTFLLNCFGWTNRKGKHTKKAKHTQMIGTYIFESTDKGKTWGHPEQVPVWVSKLQVATSEPIVWVNEPNGQPGGWFMMAGYADTGGGGDCCVLLKRRDRMNWDKPTKIAHDSSGSLNYQEPSLVDCAGGHLVCLMRVPHEEGSRIYQAHSWDNGETWEPARDTKMRGVPPNVIQLRDGRLLCTYGYRKLPYGIRACISQDEGLAWKVHKEIILRADGGGWDIGYPSTVQMKDGSLMTAYYWYTRDDKTRRIEVTKWTI